MALLATVSMVAHPQTLAVSGVVATSTMSVRYASVTFIDNSDSTKRYSVLTDTAGRYSVKLPTSVLLTDARPAEFELAQNYPNPFSTSTAISYDLNTRADVQVTIYDILGREIKRFSMSDQAAGTHGIIWDGTNNYGETVSKGVYFCQLQARGESKIRKMIFGIRGNKTFVTPLSELAARVSEAGRGINATLAGGTFTVRIENTDSTFPAIDSQRFDNVTVQSSTNLDFTVSTNGTFPQPNAALIYLDSPQQVIRGFGGANILRWRPDMTPAQVQRAFGSGPGQIGFSILRLRVPYEATEAEFSYQVPTAKLAQSLGAIVFASPWTPPAWMKTSRNIVGGRLNDTSYASYAAHLKSFADYMSRNGAPLYAISVQNEPDIQVTYESCDWNALEMVRFVKDYAPAIGTRIMAPESFNFNHTISDAILNDSTAASNLSIVGGHIYGGGIGTYPLAVSKGKEIWMTEHLDLDTTWNGVLLTGKEISDCMKAGWNAYLWWYLVRFYGPIDENGNVSKRGYVMSQFARFVRPGFTRVNSSDSNVRTFVDVTAYKNGSKLIVVAVNRNTTARNHKFVSWNGTVGSFTPYVTTNSKNCEQQTRITFKNGSFDYTLEPLSITTFVLN